MRVVKVSIALLLALGVAACSSRTQLRGVETAGLDRKLTTFAFIEEGDIVSLIVDTRATRYREDDAFMPLEICVANRGLRNLTLTRESFILFDEQGHRYHMAESRDLMEGYEWLDQDVTLAELEGIVDHRFAAFVRYPSKFSPTRTTPGVVRDRVQLPKFGYLVDRVYFPRPGTGLLNRRFELHLEAPELPHPIFVKFIVL